MLKLIVNNLVAIMCFSLFVFHGKGRVISVHNISRMAFYSETDSNHCTTDSLSEVTFVSSFLTPPPQVTYCAAGYSQRVLCVAYTMNVWHTSIHVACALCTDVHSLPSSEMMNCSLQQHKAVITLPNSASG